MSAAAVLAVVVAFAAQVPLSTAPAEEKPKTGEPKETPTEPGSPRAALQRFFSLVDEGDLDEAGALLDGADDGQAPRLARRLKSVLDHKVGIELARVSGSAAGAVDDGLDAGVDEVARFSFAGGDAQVRMVRAAGGWRFTKETVAQIDGWFAALPGARLLDRLPPALWRGGPLGLAVWQWLALPIVVVVAWGLGTVIGRLVQRLLRRATKRTDVAWDDVTVERIGGPLVLVASVWVARALVPLLTLPVAAEHAMAAVSRAVVVVAAFWALWRVIDIVAQSALAAPWAAENPASRALIPIGSRVAKVFIAAFGVVVGLSVLGFPVASIIAGLGIGGLAVALAAQKTFENLFGAFAIGIDQPFREGDFVKIDDFVGTVEHVGLRSTRVRTLDRTLITIPNGQMAEKRIESFAVRDRIRLALNLGLTYGTTGAQMRTVLADIEAALRSHPKFWPDAVTVRFSGLGESSLNIEIMAWFQTSDWAEFQLIRQEMLLRFLEIVAAAGTAVAVPTRALQMAPTATATPPLPPAA